MGMFDTLTLVPPVVCPVCGAVHNDTQTKLLSDTLSTWHEGAILRECPVSTGILNETVHCCRLGDTNEWTRIPIYLVIWHGIYAGYRLSEEDALKKLIATDRLDLLRWLEEAQQTARDWRSRYQHLRSDIEKWIDSQKNQEPDESKFARALKAIHALPEEILNDPDPLARILERNSESQPAPKGLFEW